MRKELLEKINVILSSKDVTQKQTFEKLKVLLLKGYTLSLKQQAEIRQAFRSISPDHQAKIICSTVGQCEDGCFGPMAWAYIIQKGKTVLHKGSDRCLANRLNDRNTACYYALADCLIKIQDLGLSQATIKMTTNSFSVANELNGKWYINRNHNYEQRQGVKSLLSSFPGINISYSQGDITKSGINKLIDDQLKYVKMKSVTVYKAA